MDDTLQIILALMGPVGAAAAIAGGYAVLRYKVKGLVERAERRDGEILDIRKSAVDHSHDLNMKLASACEAMAGAATKILEFEARRGEQIDRNSTRSALNRTRIDGLEAHDQNEAIRMLASSGLDQHAIEQLTGVLRRSGAARETGPQKAAADAV
jgi:hypothetical protein